MAPPSGAGRRLGLMLLLVVVLPLLSVFTPQYEVANTLIAPLVPGLALALAAMARIGWRALPAVALGAVLAAFAATQGTPGATPVADALMLLLQSAFGGLLMRRSSRPDDLALDSPPAIRRLVAVAMACALLGGLAELAADALLPGSNVTRPGVAALVRATADGASVLLLVPVVLAFAAPPRLRWAARRRSVALPLALFALALLGALAGIHERDREQALARFERDADVVITRAQALLDAPVQAVLALQGAMETAATPLIGAPFDALARPWLARSTGLAEIGWLEAARSDVGAPTVRHLLPAGANAVGGPVAAGDTPAAAPALRPTLARAWSLGGPLVAPVPPEPAAPGAPARSERSVFVVYQPLATAAAGMPRQAVFSTVLVDRVLAPLTAARSDALQACLYDAGLLPAAPAGATPAGVTSGSAAAAEPAPAADTAVRGERRRLYGPSACDEALAPELPQFSREAGFELAGRRWTMRITQPVRTPGGVWLFALPALAGGGLLATLLLGLTGRMQRLQTEASARSHDMQRDIDLLRAQSQRHERTLDGLFDAVQSGLALIGTDGRIQRANAALAELLGQPLAELRQRPIDDLLQDEDRPQQQRILGLLQASGDELVHHSLRLRLGAGRVMPALLTLRPLRERDGRISAAVCAVHDLSESLRRRQAERVLGDVLDMGRDAAASPSAAASIAPAPVPPAPAAAAAASAPGLVPAAPQRILCIHGSALQQDFLTTAFESRPQVQLRHAGSSAEGLVLAETDAPHLVLLDLALPDGDGIGLLQQLSGDPRTRAIPIIVLSGDPRPERIDAAFSAGARAYLSQPMDARQLLAAVDELI